MKHPPAEVRMDAEAVRSLLEAECPRLSASPILLVGEGWDNLTFRVGEGLAARFPRREAAVPLLLNEQRWLPWLARGLPLAVPVPLHAGVPCRRFAWPWSVVRWVRGDTAERHRFGSRDAASLAATLLALHRPAPPEAPVNPFRGVALESRRIAVERRLDRLKGHPGLDVQRLEALWRAGLAAPAEGVRRWLHGDLHPRNVVVRGGAIAGIIDWGDLCGGDPATDLACAWTLIDNDDVRSEFLTAYGATESETARAVGWAVHLGLVLLESGDPAHLAIGLATLGRIAGKG